MHVDDDGNDAEQQQRVGVLDDDVDDADADDEGYLVRWCYV